jgi:hypothetical protein
MTSELVTIDQAQQIVHAHLAGHDQSIVKSISQVENKGYRSGVDLTVDQESNDH